MAYNMYKGEPVSIPVVFNGDPFVRYGKTYADITDVYMGLKVKTETDADDMFLSKVSPAGVTFDEPTHTFTMLLDQVDTEELEPRTYELVIGVLMSGLSKRIELYIPDPDVVIAPDKVRF